jgi:plasmid maintenance system antidote protein VapI
MPSLRLPAESPQPQRPSHGRQRPTRAARLSESTARLSSPKSERSRQKPSESSPSPGPEDSPYVRCSARTKAGKRCRGWAVRGTDPPRCGAHGGGKRPPGVHKGTQNSLKHGFYSAPVGHLSSLDDIIQDLAIRQARLSAYIDRQGEAISIDEIVRLLHVHGRNASRLGRLLRQKRAISGEVADGLSDAIAQAIDELSAELAVEL